MTKHISQTLIALCALATLIACERVAVPQEQQITKPTPDLSTPDKALKSYWAMQDWLTRDILSRHPRDFVNKRLIAMREVTDGEAYAAIYHGHKDQTPPRIERDIKSVNVETETRAVIHAVLRDISPVAPEVHTRDLEERAKGTLYRYIVERSDGQWRITQAWHQWFSGDEWRKAFNPHPSVSRHVAP